MIRLTIVIPAYNAEPYLSELLDCLSPQITDEVEVIVVDDGSRQQVSTDHKWCKVIRQKNQGCSKARNVGIDKAQGEYISFIDADDLVSKDFVHNILEKTKSHKYEVLEFSWKSLTTKMWNLTRKLEGDQDRLPNPSVCTRAFKKSFIGDTRFNLKKDSTEDEDFSRKLGYLGHEKEIDVGVIPDFMYYYRDDVPMSKTKKYAKGLMNTKKVIYYFDHVAADRTDILEQIKQDDEVNEVFLMTNRCDIPGIDRWCQVIKPRSDWAHIIKGEKTDRITLRRPPLRTQVVIYRRHINTVGGLRTFIRQFIEELSDKYDITLLCRTCDEASYAEFTPKVRVIADTIRRAADGRLIPIDAGGSAQPIVCDSLVVLSMLDALPTNVMADKIIRMVHTCKTQSDWEVPKDYDELIWVSDTSRRSFKGEDGIVLHNMIKAPEQKALVLVSATRFPAPDKGDIERRMRRLAKMLGDAGIPHIWLNFSDGALPDPPKHFYNMGASEQMPEIIKAADYLVSLSDSECWSYSCLEALTAGTALICTGFPSTVEMGIKDGVNAHVVPFDMDFDVKKLLQVPEFTYDYDNEAIRKEWVRILGDTKPKKDYKPDKIVLVEVLEEFRDTLLDKIMPVGTVYQMMEARARHIVATQPRLLRIVGG